MDAAIETERLTKTHGKDRGTRDVDLEVAEGGVFGSLRPNGAGKTTTIRTLLGFMRPMVGRAEVFGLDAKREAVEVRAWVGNLPGEFAPASGRQPPVAAALPVCQRDPSRLDDAPS